jgi:cob(I)alamin adenosyltransferase
MPVPFYTRKGDDGYTGLLGEGRVAKNDIRMEALGAVDEAGAALGVARAVCRSQDAPPILLQVQRDLYGLMAELAATPKNAETFRTIDSGRVTWLESQVDALSAKTETPKEFIIPGDTVNGAFLDLARAVVRRAERRVAALFHQQGFENREIMHYLNRLSSLCFLLELYENQAVGNTQITIAKVDPKK